MVASARPPILVIGLGNPILGDDAIGWRIAQEVQSRLEKTADPAGSEIEFDFLSLGGLSLMERLVGYRQALLIDAIATGEHPIGTVLQFDLEDLPAAGVSRLASAHDTSLRTAIEMGRALQAVLPDQIHIVAVESHLSLDFGENLSPAALAAIDPASRLALEIIAAMSKGTPAER